MVRMLQNNIKQEYSRMELIIIQTSRLALQRFTFFYHLCTWNITLINMHNEERSIVNKLAKPKSHADCCNFSAFNAA
ncbi:hypothetical protein A4A49_01322 [Nicotiana attenuata]|uniref:Uncharacterized protein n=1 Tax=Nicotiana attenuata TaxID=49451 RepID=A0A1J6IGZ7_NICAT|nr:hypothetical protein A4A49_01322 [Nicotiana attenuata]